MLQAIQPIPPHPETINTKALVYKEGQKKKKIQEQKPNEYLNKVCIHIYMGGCLYILKFVLHFFQHSDNIVKENHMNALKIKHIFE